MTCVSQPWQPALADDITPEARPANLDRLAAALRVLEARVGHIDTPQGLPFSYDATSLAAESSWDLTTPFGDLDIAFTPAGSTGYGRLS